MTFNIGKQRKDWRQHRQLTQEGLALDSGTSVSYLRQIEHGKANPTIQKLEELCGVLGLELQISFIIPDSKEENR